MQAQEYDTSLTDAPERALAALPIRRDKELFLRELLRELAGVIEDTVGLEQAESFIAMVGDRIGAVMSDEYRDGLGVASLDLEHVAAALVDLKRRIDGDFRVVRVAPDYIELVNARCPFGEHVHGRPSLCMMTSSVFGRIAADNFGFARVEIPEAIANGDGRCRVTVHLTPGETGRNFFR